jgi:hypothetical protein
MIITTEKTIEKQYVFTWENVPGNDEDRLARFLIRDYDQKWVRRAKFKKNDETDIIRIVYKDKLIKLSLNANREKCFFKIGDRDNIILTTKPKPDGLRIYTKKRTQQHVITEISDAPITLPPGYTRAGIWIQFKNDVLEIHIPQKDTQYLRIGDLIDRTDYEIIKQYIRHALKRYNDLTINKLQKHMLWYGTEVIEI